MNVKGLMLDNWVRIPSGQVCKVKTLNTDGTVGVGVGATDLMGFDARLLSPVALTAELLLANGFEVDEDNIQKFSDGETEVVFYGGWTYASVRFEDAGGYETATTIRAEVHRLQNLWNNAEMEREFRMA